MVAIQSNLAVGQIDDAKGERLTGIVLQFRLCSDIAYGRGNVVDFIDDDQTRIAGPETFLGRHTGFHPIAGLAAFQGALHGVEQTTARAMDIAGGHILLPHDLARFAQHGISDVHHFSLADAVIAHCLLLRWGCAHFMANPCEISACAGPFATQARGALVAYLASPCQPSGDKPRARAPVCKTWRKSRGPAA